MKNFHIDSKTGLKKSHTIMKGYEFKDSNFGVNEAGLNLSRYKIVLTSRMLELSAFDT